MAKKIPIEDGSLDPEKRHSDKFSVEPRKVVEIESIDDVVETGGKTDEPHLAVEPHKNVFQRFGSWFWRKKYFTLPPIFLVIVIGVLLAIPSTRYPLISGFWKESFSVKVVDAASGKPVSEATVKLNGAPLKTGAEGYVGMPDFPVGQYNIVIEKKYYASQSLRVTLDWFTNDKTYEVKLVATGRSVPVAVTDRLTGKPIKDALIRITSDNQARTDAEGKASIVLPADKPEVAVSLIHDEYLFLDAKLAQNGPNQLQLVPVGSMYFLSKLSGKIDVVKTNLDGSNRKIILAGTGFETDHSTNLLATTDWKYLMLKSKRDPAKPESLTLVSTADDTYSTADEGDAEFSLAGWSGHDFVYTIDRTKVEYGAAKRQALKTFDADTKKITTIEENAAQGESPYSSFHESIENVYFIGDMLSYTKRWWSTNYTPYEAVYSTDKEITIHLVRPDGIDKKVRRSFPLSTYSGIQAKVYQPHEIYYQVGLVSGADAQYFELEGDDVKSVKDGQAEFEKPYPTYLVSPNGNETSWADERDGKKALFIGDKNGENEQLVAQQSEFSVYGWLTDNYLLLQKNNSELYIIGKNQLRSGAAPLKISDYHKPAGSIYGYGSGYGGL